MSVVMTGKEFLNKIANSTEDILQELLDLLKKNNANYCAIGGLAVNAYAEPVVSLDLDIVIINEQLGDCLSDLRKQFHVVEFPNSINISKKGSDLRIQIQTDPRYQSFVEKAVVKDVLGYDIPVAAIEDVLAGKIWAAMDRDRRPSKRQKDFSDILRLIETNEELISLLPDSLNKRLFSDL